MFNDNKRTSVILAGGVAKGAFQAGALEVLSQQGMPVSQIVAASSGALNGALYAAGVRAGRPRDAARRLVELWRDEGHWTHAFDLSLSGTLHGRGLSTVDKLLHLLRAELAAFDDPATQSIELRLVIAALQGRHASVDHKEATTFEELLWFDEEDFEDGRGRDKIARGVAASAAFPLLYEPVDIEGRGPCVDGGVVNNTPIRHAVDVGAERIVVIAPSPAVAGKLGTPSGVALVGQIADILLGERMYRDLRDAARVNEILGKLDGLVQGGFLDSEQHRAVRDILGWRRHLDLVCIRPDKELPGHAFSGLFDRSLREAYIAAGREAASKALLKN